MKHQTSIQKSIKKYFLYILSPLWLLGCFSCTKFLDAKPDGSLAIPTTAQDVQALLDAYYNLNNTDPGSSEVAADNYYITSTDWATQTEPYRRMYTWENDRVFSSYQNDWSKVYNCNTVLDNMQNINRTIDNATTWDNAKGTALLMRGKAYLQGAFIWCKQYDITTAATDLGLPLRTDADFNKASIRLSVAATYNQIISDLKEALPLLPNSPTHVIRPSIPAANGLLARAYLAMRQYDSCWKYTNAALALKNTLLDYNSLTATASFPIKQLNVEVVMENLIPVPTPLNSSRAKIDSVLYSTYAVNDLRKTIFFKNNNNGSYAFKGSYEGAGNLFSGVAVDELYLMRAECYARMDKTQDAMNDLNTLLLKRWATGTFVPLAALTPNDALVQVLIERRKELLLRGLRWMDIKRLNKEGYNIVPTRIINGTTYSLPVNDLRYAMALPEDVIALSGMQQNPR